MSTTTSKTRATIDLPPEVEMVFREFSLCEFSTLARDGTPITWPVAPFYQPDTGCFLITTSIGLPQKAFNIRRNPKVSLLFSDPVTSGLVDPPTVLVQGTAEAPDELITSFDRLKENILSPSARERQPRGSMFSSNPVMRYLMDFYYMRLYIWVTPRRILWWKSRDLSRAPEEVVIDHVE